ncbi:MAG TPA: FAD-dependent oxidoreductase [Acidimicrobiales bacterium]|nr:FAD-dependent oxidoreductase [Acidimicrobiales bacterium]
MTDSYDLIVIGAGMAGAAAAHKCASEGWRVAIVDELPYGGTCALRGCDPKKILRRGAASRKRPSSSIKTRRDTPRLIAPPTVPTIQLSACELGLS